MPQAGAVYTNLKKGDTDAESISNCSSNVVSVSSSVAAALSFRGNKLQDGNKELNNLLESQFEIGDALRLTEYQGDRDTTDLESAASPAAYDLDDTTTLNKVFTNKSTGELELPLDKGYGWVVVLSVFLAMFITWGCNSAFGVFLSFFLSHGTFDGATKYDYAIIAGLPVALCQGLSSLSMMMMRVIGVKLTMLIGTVIMLAGYLWASFATHLWELYLTQGVMIGISMALVSMPPAACLPGWFLKKRAVSMGLSLLGTGIGGVTFGLAANKMISDYGDTRWCYRMLAITCTGVSLIAIVLVRERIPIKPTGLRSIKNMRKAASNYVDVKIMKLPTVLLICAWFNLGIFAYSLMIYTLASYAVARGMSQHQGSILTALLNVGQTVGRPAIGLIGDRYGRYNVIVVHTFLLTVYTFAFWIPATTFVQLIFFALMCGFSVGVSNVMNSVVISDIMPPEQVLPTWGFVIFTGTGPLLVVELIAQALTQPGKSNPYIHTQIFSGFCFFTSFVLSLVLKERSVRVRTKAKLQKVMDQIDVSSSITKEFDKVSERQKNLESRKVKYEKILQDGIQPYFKRAVFPCNT
ncbi:MCT family MFS transporter KNAG_0I02165 [Huiozyma naganishii CBS 8797]|uniref:Major facilitator superfamily (MFS) profile domain-containing protein n=1 Tax=Huiozyma naganishii (strain ATCC MYA-139 / BCRC 22969 / CBS 8797 / KCTC 17520 / NBRC 10181 / NCYC 3082 / Yp74L-3) TaxID=1071383 RepID=J7S2G6_HUIN7|nr:hypothetical protein KNAG_0I02165 [Kazachstania naganishii CBS 8797]CCK72002.1 hypothetical protein KNAG_0I02165 [Kazachstania naganishii CBS 8797]